jgi:hypothetical protein
LGKLTPRTLAARGDGDTLYFIETELMNLTLLDIPVVFRLGIEVYIICIVIAVTTFFLCKWIFKNFIKTERTRKFIAVAIAVVATPLIYLGLIRLLVLGITYTPSKDFDKSRWMIEKERRFEMAGDIIRSKMLISRDTTEVKQILGDPTGRQNTINAWTYDMGMGGGGLGFLFHILVVKFENNRVVGVEHAEVRD